MDDKRKRQAERERRLDIAINMVTRSATHGEQVLLESDDAMLIMAEIERLSIELSIYKLRDAGMLDEVTL